MIVHVVDPPKGKSSFFRLQDYIVAGIDAHVDSRAVSFENLASYMTAESTIDVTGDQVEKCIAVEAGNVTNLRNASKEMWAVAQQNSRCVDPVYHYILSWPENERPPVADIMAAARHTLAALGLQEHQYLVAVHANTDNIHAHVAVNKIHPLTHMAKHIEWSHKTLHKAAREAEIQFGWQHDPGLWEVMEIGGKKVLFPRKSYLQDVLPLSSKAKNYEVWNGRESFEGWVKKKPALALRRALEKPTSWQDIHQALSAYGIELTDSGGGGLRVELLRQSEEDKPVAVAASRVFRFMKRKELEKAIGPFVPLDPNGPAPARVETYKRDPIKRVTRRLERLAQRETLWDQYLAYSSAIKAEKAETTAFLAGLRKDKKQADAERYRLMKASYAAKRRELKADNSLSSTQKQQAYMLLKMTYEQAREELKDQLAIERKAIDDLLPKTTSWREWVEEQAQQGNEAAISALRGMVYEEKRQAKRGKPAASELPPSIRPAPARLGEDPTIRLLVGLAWQVSSNGRILYRFKKSNELAFVDEGPQLSFGRRDVTDEALLATLRYAKMKWGDTLHVDGGDAVFRERLVRLASSLNMTVDNQELKELQQQAIGERTTSPATQGQRMPLPAPIDAPLAVDLKRANPTAQIALAESQENTYRGKIERVDQTHALQKVGQDRYVLHDLRMLDKLPAVGTEIAIRYRAGSGKVSENTRSKGR